MDFVHAPQRQESIINFLFAPTPVLVGLALELESNSKELGTYAE